MRRGLDRLVAALDRLVLRIFFRRVEVVGGERLPPGRPLVVVANHVNGMVDPLLIVGALPIMPRFLGKHTLWRNPALRPWLALGGVLPIYRRQDLPAPPAAGQGEAGVGAADGAPQAEASQNAETFARCYEELAAGGAIALFPEGISHSEPALAPLKTGAARIVIEAERRFPGLGTLIVPVGLTFEAKGTFRSRALVEIGAPIDPLAAAAPEAARAGAPDPVPAQAPEAPEAVRALTRRIDQGLRAVTLNYGSWEEARLIGRAAELFARPGVEVPGSPRLAERFDLHRAFVEGYGELCRRFPERTAAAARAVERYDRMLRAFGLRDDQVAAAYPVASVARFTLLTALRLAVLLPLAACGILLNWPTYRLVGGIAARATREPDITATYKVFGGIFLYPLTWVAEAAVGAWLAGTHGAAAFFSLLAAAPATGYFALRFDDRRARLWREARAYLVLRTRQRLAAEIKQARAGAAREVGALAGLYLAGSADSPANRS